MKENLLYNLLKSIFKTSAGNKWLNFDKFNTNVLRVYLGFVDFEWFLSQNLSGMTSLWGFCVKCKCIFQGRTKREINSAILNPNIFA